MRQDNSNSDNNGGIDGGDDHSMDELSSDHDVDDCESDSDATAVDNQLLDALMAMPERDDATDAIRSPSSCSSSTTYMDVCSSVTVDSKWTSALPHQQQQQPPLQQHVQQRKKSPRKWIHAIQNASYQPKPTAFSPHGSFEENPLLEQQRQCRDKLDALASVRKRVHFLPFVASTTLSGTAGGKRFEQLEPSMKIHTRMILSKLESDSHSSHRAHSNNTRSSDTDTLAYYESAGIDALAGLECLFFAFLTPRELIHASEVCRSWKDMARHNVIWEPLLFTPFERYPLRELLGASADLPAIQIFMIFKRLRLTELPKDATKRAVAGGEPRRHAMQVTHRIRVVEERQRLLMPMRIGGLPNRREREPMNVAPLVVRPPSRMQPSIRMTSIHVVGFATKAAAVATALDPRDDAELEDEYAELLANPHARTDRDDELQFIKDGYSRMTMRVWLQQQQQHRRKLSEATLRSFLRQILLAIQALEQVGAMHSDISLANIVVLEQADPSPATTFATAESSAGEREDDAMPLFQLDCSRNIVLLGRPEGLDDRALRYQVPATMAMQATRLQHPDGRFGAMRERRRDAAAILPFAVHEDAEIRGDVMLELADDMMHRHGRPSCMFAALFRCAVSAWSRGRFPDSSLHNHMPLLSLLVLLHAHIPAGLRSFVEFGAFLTDSGLLTAAHLLQHAYVTADPTTPETIAIRNIQAQDVRDYQVSVQAWYSSAYATAQAAVRQRQSGQPTSVSSERAATLADALMPKTHMAATYLEHALKERNLSQERFVSIVAPEIKSSSWMRKVAETQRHTLQRLDLSRVMLPTSVLLQELANLPRITHLRLPVNIERPDDLEHFLAALTCTDLLPNLCAMDANVQGAMDRMEQTYRVQLDMVEFLLGR